MNTLGRFFRYVRETRQLLCVPVCLPIRRLMYPVFICCKLDNSERKYCKSIYFGVVLFPKGEQIILTELSPLEMYPLPLSIR